MKFASFKINGATSWGLIDGAEAVDVGAVLRSQFPDLKSAIAAGALAQAAAAAGLASGASAADAFGANGGGEGEAMMPVVEQRVLDEEHQVGRNDPCWCGSGKKFKKCHGT